MCLWIFLLFGKIKSCLSIKADTRVQYTVTKRSSIFDDRSRENEELSALIKSDITAINMAFSDLQTLQNMETAGGNYSADRVVHLTAVCDDMKNRLMAVTKQFQDVLTTRSKVLFQTAVVLTYYICWKKYNQICPCNVYFSEYQGS